jgi:GSH-dependent disulfide-bond oxidoreductase
LKVSPDNKIPVLVDHDGLDGKPITLFESGAILLYLAEKIGWQFFPADMRRRYEVMQWVMQWLMFQMAGIGRMLGQAHHFRMYAREMIPYAIGRYTNEAHRIYSVIDRRLGEAPYLAGDYLITDITYPWIRPYKWQGQNIAEFPNLIRWYQELGARPAVRRGLAVLEDRFANSGGKPSGTSSGALFGSRQFEHR